MLQNDRASSAALFCSSMEWSNERDVKPSEEVVDSDAGKSWTATVTVPASRLGHRDAVWRWLWHFKC